MPAALRAAVFRTWTWRAAYCQLKTTGMLRGGGVEVGPRRQPALADARDIDARGLDPLARGPGLGLLPHPLLDLGDRAELHERLHRFAAGRADGVDVALDQAGHDGPALGVDHPRLVADQLLDLGVGADQDEDAVADGDRLGRGRTWHRRSGPCR